MLHSIEAFVVEVLKYLYTKEFTPACILYDLLSDGDRTSSVVILR